AYYHYLLFELYGAVPIVDKVYSTGDNLKLSRAPVDSVVNFIDSELTRALDKLPQNPIFEDENRRALPTKGVALAVRTKLWVFAASPLYNGGYDEALNLTNSKGEKLFPSKDGSKWQKAVAAAQDFIEYSKGNYELYKI